MSNPTSPSSADAPKETPEPEDKKLAATPMPRTPCKRLVDWHPITGPILEPAK